MSKNRDEDRVFEDALGVAKAVLFGGQIVTGMHFPAKPTIVETKTGKHRVGCTDHASRKNEYSELSGKFIPATWGEQLDPTDRRMKTVIRCKDPNGNEVVGIGGNIDLGKVLGLDHSLKVRAIPFKDSLDNLDRNGVSGRGKRLGWIDPGNPPPPVDLSTEVEDLADLPF